MGVEQFSEGHIHRCNRIGGVDVLANFGGEREEGSHSLPMVFNDVDMSP